MIEVWSRGAAEEHMDEAILVDLVEQVRRHPWWRARTALTLQLMAREGFGPGTPRPRPRVIDVGCGWGTTLEDLEARGLDVAGLDVAERGLRRLDRPARRLIVADLSKPLTPPDRFDVVLALDVIEHLDDDETAVANLAALLAPGGLLILSAPARPDLFSHFDEIQGHRRRYLPGRIESLVRRPELTDPRVFWWGAWMVPLMKARRGRRGREGESPSAAYRRYLASPPPPLDLPLRLAFRLERRHAVAGRLPTGTSLFAVARRAL